MIQKRIEIYRKEQKKWVYEAFEADDEVELTTLDVRFPIDNAYEDVIFEKEKTTIIQGNNFSTQ